MLTWNSRRMPEQEPLSILHLILVQALLCWPLWVFYLALPSSRGS